MNEKRLRHDRKQRRWIDRIRRLEEAETLVTNKLLGAGQTMFFKANEEVRSALFICLHAFGCADYLTLTSSVVNNHQKVASVIMAKLPE